MDSTSLPDNGPFDAGKKRLRAVEHWLGFEATYRVVVDAPVSPTGFWSPQNELLGFKGGQCTTVVLDTVADAPLLTTWLDQSVSRLGLNDDYHHEGTSGCDSFLNCLR